MANDYIWPISYASNVVEAARNNTVSFGDGYEQISADGINSMPITLDVVHEHVNDTDLTAILTLLRARRGVSYFLWTPTVAGYTASERKFRCDKWQVQPLQYNDTRLTASFRQVFDL